MKTKLILYLLLSALVIADGVFLSVYSIIPNRTISEIGMYIAWAAALAASICITALVVPELRVYLSSKEARKMGFENVPGFKYNKTAFILFTIWVLLIFSCLH